MDQNENSGESLDWLNISATTSFCSKSLFSSLNLLTPWQFTLSLLQMKALSPNTQSQMCLNCLIWQLNALLPVVIEHTLWFLKKVVFEITMHVFKTALYIYIYVFNTLMKPLPVSDWSWLYSFLFYRQHTGVLKIPKQLKGKGKNRKRLRNRRWPPLCLVAAGWRLVYPQAAYFLQKDQWKIKYLWTLFPCETWDVIQHNISHYIYI